MNKFLLLPLALALSGCLAQAESIEDQPQVNIAAQQYEVESVNCNQVCIATVKADEYSIYVRYQMDDASVDRTEILNVVHSDETVNAYIDQDEIQKINAAIVGGVK